MSDEHKADIWEEADRLRAALAERDARIAELQRENERLQAQLSQSPARKDRQ